MTAIAYAYAEKTTRVTTTSTSYVDVDATDGAAAIVSSHFVVGEPYLLVVMAQADTPDANLSQWLRVLHGSTAFADSEFSTEPGGSTARQAYAWFDVWTAVSGEGIKLQLKCENGVTVAGVDQVTIFALPLTGLTYQYNANGTDTTLTTSYQDGASITFTPAGAGAWLVLSLARFTGTSGSQSCLSRLSRSGEATETEPETTQEGEDTTNDRLMHTLAKVLSLGAASNTFKEQSRQTGDAAHRTHSKVFALSLAGFRTVAWQYNASHVDYTAGGTFSDTLATADITPAMDGAVWCLSSFVTVPNGLGFGCNARQRFAGADLPGTQTSDGYSLMTSWDATDAPPVAIQGVKTSAGTGTSTLVLHASMASATAGRGARSRLALAVLLETPPGGGTGPVYPVSRTIVRPRIAPVVRSRW